ncbi:MAG: hypothetical protein KME40_18260 [Komarekiella atlantica HA4396-MV6]|jgi:hypothetical protein|nr:hypothetical protein [Komarekiella atlantica HA4396-MV6]
MTACRKDNQVLTTSFRLDKVTFGTNCIIKAKHGRFYQTIVTGTDKDHVLDVTIKMGESQVFSDTQLLIGVR